EATLSPSREAGASSSGACKPSCRAMAHLRLVLLQVQPRALAARLGPGDRVQLLLTEQDVRDALELDLAPVIRVEEHCVTDRDLAHAVADRGDLAPRELAAHDGRRGDHDPGRGPTLRGVVVEAYQEAVAEHA